MRSLLLFVVCLTAFSACSKEPTAKSSSPAAGTPAGTPTLAPTAVPVRAKSSPGARVFIVDPRDGAEVTSPVTVKFGAEGIAVEPAGEVKGDSGHHHLLIDVENLPSLDQPLPFSDTILHFGQAQTEASVNLAPGTHTLQLVLAGGNHVPHDPPVVSERITITVK